jgi:hypothetical protein
MGGRRSLALVSNCSCSDIGSRHSTEPATSLFEKLQRFRKLSNFNAILKSAGQVSFQIRYRSWILRMSFPQALPVFAMIAVIFLNGLMTQSAMAQNNPPTEMDIIALRELAGAGNSGALKRLGDAYARGTGVEQNWEKAIESYQAALAAGRKSTRLSLARALAKSGQGEAALKEYNTALAGGADKAKLPLALGHTAAIFGHSSDPALGFFMLQELVQQGNEQAIFGMAESYRMGRGTNANPGQAANLYAQLVKRGNSRAARRLADLYARGNGVEQNYDRAIDLYQLAIDAGHVSVGLSLGRVFLRAGQPEAALRAYNTALAAGERRAEVPIAAGHATSEFGRLSDPDKGVVSLEKLALAGNIRAQNALLRLIERGKGPAIGNLEGVLLLAEQAASTGQIRSVEQLLRLYRVRPKIARNTVSKREVLLQDFGHLIRPEVTAIERIYRLHETQLPPRYYAQMLDIIAAAPRDKLARILPGLIRINRNAYIYVLQGELRSQGYLTRRPNGWLTGSTIRATAAFCRDENIMDICRLGPLKGVVAKAIATVLAAQPANS